jgi:signal transduction histidine kinase
MRDSPRIRQAWGPRLILAAAAIGLLALCPPGLAAQARNAGRILELRDGIFHVELLPYALVALESGTKTPPQRLSFRPDLERFKIPAPGALRGFIDSRAVWLCFTIRSAASSRSWLIAAGPKIVDSVSVYIVDPDGRVESFVSDAERRTREGPGSLADYSFSLTIGPGEVKTVYMRFAAESLLSVSAGLWDSFRYLRTVEVDSIFMGLLLGVIIAVFLYTFFIAISLREGIYAYYLAYLLGLGFLVLALSGGFNPLWHAGGAWAAKRAIPFFSSLMAFGMAVFARRFLDLRSSSPFFSRALLGVAAGVPLFAASLAFLDLRFVTASGIFFDMAARLTILAAAIYAATKGGKRRERYFLASWIVASLGAIAARLGAAGILDPASAPFWGNSEQAGALIQILLLAYGITDAIYAMRSEKEEGQRRSILLLERANKVKEDFVIGTSLEFRSPLFGIVGLVDAMDELALARVARGDGAGELYEERRLAALIKAEALRLLGSVANIAAYVRIRNGDLALTAERVSLKDVVDGAIGSASHIASGKDIAVQKAIESAEIGTDERLLEQVVFNLLAHAFKASPAGIVRIEAGVEGGLARISIVDSAPPLAEEVLGRFRSKGNPSGPEAVGPGLDLLVARLIAERLGGTLAYSWSAGHGRFDLELPRECSWRQTGRAVDRGAFVSLLGRIAARGARPVQADLSETPPGKGSRGLVLAYDEDPVFLEALKRYLEGRGYAVAPTLSADKAVELAAERRFDLVLLDASGQGRAGLAACARMRAARGIDELPIVVMTDRESVEAVEAAFRAGASDYLPKLSPNELLFARVDNLVGLKRSVEEALETRRHIAELEKLKTLGVLAAGVAHEVNTPNNAIIRNLPVISEVWRELAPSILRLMDEAKGFSVRGWSAKELVCELPELLADTYSAGLQIKKIVEDLKDYARDSSGSPPAPVDISDVAAYACRLLQPLVGRSTHRFVLDAPAGLPRVSANFQKLTQVAVSILENALQSLPNPEAGVTLRTRFDPERSRVVLECEDEGRGIPDSLIEKVFEPFFTTKSDSGGTGLGLSVARGIVRDAGGEIEIESRVERGAAVRVVLPAMADAIVRQR